MTAYTVTWRNPKSGALEAWRTEAATPADLELSLAFWCDIGYEIVFVKEVPRP